MDDIRFVSRIVDQVFSGSVPDLEEGAQHLAERVKIILASEKPQTGPMFEESCPACMSAIPFEDSVVATCPNGHIWGKLKRTRARDKQVFT